MLFCHGIAYMYVNMALYILHRSLSMSNCKIFLKPVEMTQSPAANNQRMEKVLEAYQQKKSALDSGCNLLN